MFHLIKQNLTENINVHCRILEMEFLRKLGISFTLLDSSKKEVAKIVLAIKAKWQASNRTEHRFLDKNKGWIETVMTFSRDNSSDSYDEKKHGCFVDFVGP